MQNYSTEEVAIGIWIDGNTLYRRCFDVGSNVITVVAEKWINLVYLGSNAIGTLVNGVVIDTTATKSISPVFVSYSDQYLQCYSYGTIRFDKFIIEYTKP